MSAERDFYENHNCKDMPVFKELEAENARLREVVKVGFAAQERADYEAIEMLKAELTRLRGETANRQAFDLAQEVGKLREEVAFYKAQAEMWADRFAALKEGT